jgi:trk system potassium uptake protein TrkA
MNILVVGCGRLGAELADRLFRQGHHVTVVDQTSTAFANLPGDFRGRLVEGEVLSRQVLDRARMFEADAVAAVTSSDSTNVVVAHVARRIFQVANVAVRNYDPRRREVQEDFGLPVVSSSSWGARRVEEILTFGGVTAVLSAGNGDIVVYELAITPAWTGQKIAALLAGCEIRPVALTRRGRGLLPDGDTVLEADDRLMVSSTHAGIESLQTRLDSGAEG